MQKILAMMLTLPLIGCASVQIGAVCDGTERSRDKLNLALLEDGGPKSVSAGATLIGQIDAVCR